MGARRRLFPSVRMSVRAVALCASCEPACRAKPSTRCAARPQNVFYHEASGDKKLWRTLRAEAAAYAQRSRPRRTLRSHDCQRALRKLSVHACSRLVRMMSPHCTVQALRAREKGAVVLPVFGSLAIVAGWTWCASTRGGRGVRDARTIVSALLHVS